MRRGPLPTLLAALLVGLGLAVVSAHAANQTVMATSSDTFEPAAVTISQGETVTWTNAGGSHNVSFDGGSFTEPATPSTDSWTVSRRFDTPGTFHYVCVQHAPDMEGTVTVIAAQTGGTPPLPPPPGTPGTDTTAPVISRFGMTHTRFRVKRGASAFVFRVSEPVDVRIKISRVLKRRGKTRYVEKGTLVRTELRRTSQKVPFSGKLARRALPAGVYRGTITATDLARNRSLPKRTSFRVVRR
jgi:plastocyanin